MPALLLAPTEPHQRRGWSKLWLGDKGGRWGVSGTSAMAKPTACATEGIVLNKEAGQDMHVWILLAHLHLILKSALECGSQQNLTPEGSKSWGGICTWWGGWPVLLELATACPSRADGGLASHCGEGADNRNDLVRVELILTHLPQISIYVLYSSLVYRRSTLMCLRNNYRTVKFKLIAHQFTLYKQTFMELMFQQKWK